jgi:hypothetical protein
MTIDAERTSGVAASQMTPLSGRPTRADTVEHTTLD